MTIANVSKLFKHKKLLILTKVRDSYYSKHKQINEQYSEKSHVSIVILKAQLLEVG